MLTFLSASSVLGVERVEVFVPATSDGTKQPAFLLLPADLKENPRPRPLLVGLHTWSGDYHQRNEKLEKEASARGWIVLLPNFRGRNDHPEACGSTKAQQDIVDTLEWVKKRYPVDERRVYLTGDSGGGHMTMLMVGRHPHLWTAASAWVGISDLATWRRRHAGKKYGNMVDRCCGGAPGTSSGVDAEYRARSPLTWMHRAVDVPIDLNAGVHDGHRGSVPIRQTIDAYNAIARASGATQVTEEEIDQLSRPNGRLESPAPSDRVEDASFGREIHLRRRAGKARVTIFEGGHEGIPTATIAWLTRHAGGPPRQARKAPRRPNILLAISDDQSFPHAGAYGCSAVKTPAFDRVAREGLLFRNAFCASPGCSPSRAALLTGRHTWQIEQAGTHASSFPKKYDVYTELLQTSGYHVGHTGKGWGPGDHKVSGRPTNPAGPAYSSRRLKQKPALAVRNTDYAACFEDFLAERPEGSPFCFWYGASEPHRQYRKGSGLAAGKRLEDVVVPPFLPDTPEIRSDLLDYFLEIEWFDRHLGRMLASLQKRGELDSTLVIVTGDNGMPFPRAKANGYEYGIHVPLAVRWPERVPGGRIAEDLVGFVDLAPTMLAAAGAPIPETMTGRSLLSLLASTKGGLIDPTRTRAYSARERHSYSRHRNRGYPIRAMRTPRYLYIRNFHPERWPAGHPSGFRGAAFGYHDIDGCPSKTFLVQSREHERWGRFLDLAVAKRPAEELYDITVDPGNIVDLHADPDHAKILAELRRELGEYLERTGDPRAGGGGDVFETYPRLRGSMRKFPAPREKSGQR